MQTTPPIPDADSIEDFERYMLAHADAFVLFNPANGRVNRLTREELVQLHRANHEYPGTLLVYAVLSKGTREALVSAIYPSDKGPSKHVKGGLRPWVSKMPWPDFDLVEGGEKRP